MGAVKTVKDALPSRAEAWSQYWASGVLHSCPGSFEANYAGHIGEFWAAVFAELEPESRVLDACCGNATMSQLLLAAPQGRGVVRIDAVDAARIAPPWLEQAAEEDRARVQLHARTSMESLPFEAADFDLCVSQYGIEYVGAEAVRECSRVLRPGGRLAAVLHHVESLPVRIAHVELEHVDYLLEDGGLYACAEALLAPLARAGTPEGREALQRDPAANAARAAFNRALRDVAERIEQETYPALLIEQREQLMHLMSQIPRHGAERGQHYLDSMRRALLAGRLRQAELIEFALDEAGVRSLLENFVGGIDQLQQVMFEDGQIAGWSLVAIRGDQAG